MGDFEFIVEENRTEYSAIKTYKDLVVWQKSIDLVEEVYRITKSLPDDEKYGLISQMKRASISVPSNIAEGWGRKSTGNYLQFLKIANGSLCEIETQLIIIERLIGKTNIDFTRLNSLLTETGKMLRSLINSIEQFNKK